MEKVQQTDGKTIYNKDNKKQLQVMTNQQNGRWVLKDKTWWKDPTPADGSALPLEADCHKGHQGIERTVIGVRR